MELMVGECPHEVLPGCSKGVMEHIVRVIDPVYPAGGSKAPFVKSGVVGYKRISFQERFDLSPYLREERRILRVLRPQAVNLAAEPLIVIRLRVDKRIESVHDDIIAHDDKPHGADAGRALIRGLPVNSVEG